MKSIQTRWRGIVTDRLNSLKTRYTRYYDSEREAHYAAELICRRTMKERGNISVDWKDFTYNVKEK